MRDELWVKHDVRSREDGKMRWFLKRAGMEGYGFFWAVIEKLHYQNDHTIPLSGPEFEGIADDIFLSPDRFLELCKLAADAGLFKIADNVLWQKRLKEEQETRTIAKSRWDSNMRELGQRGGLASAAKRKDAILEKSKENSQLKPEEPTEAGPKRTLDRRERIDRIEREEKREKKEKNIIKNEISDSKPGYRDGTKTFGEYNNVFLTEVEYEKLISDFGSVAVDSKITSLDSNIENGVTKYLKFKQHAACVRNWCTSDRASGRVPKEEPLPNGFTWVDRNTVRGPTGETHHISFVRNMLTEEKLR